MDDILSSSKSTNITNLEENASEENTNDENEIEVEDEDTSNNVYKCINNSELS